MRICFKMECKRHSWRVGSGIGELINKKLVTTKLNIWCERCDKKIKASYFSSYELNNDNIKSRLKGKNKQKVAQDRN